MNTSLDRALAVRTVVRRLVDYYRPERIYLIGSTARGDDRPDSDLDFVVVLPDDAPRELLVGGHVHQRLWTFRSAWMWFLSAAAPSRPAPRGSCRFRPMPGAKERWSMTPLSR